MPDKSPTTKYATSAWVRFGLITEVECQKETAQSVWVASKWGGKKTFSRAAKISDRSQYHDTWEAAKQYLLRRQAADVEGKERALADSRERLARIMALTPPTTEQAP